MSNEPSWSQSHTVPPAPAAAPRKWWRRKSFWTHIAAGFAGLVLGIASASDSETSDAEAAPTPTETVTEAPQAPEDSEDSEDSKKGEKSEEEPEKEPEEKTEEEPEKEPEPEGPAEEIGPGTYLVGEDMAVGEWKTEGSDRSCYWSRNSNSSGEFDSIIANDNLTGPGRVTLNDGEYFQTTTCTWTLA